MISLVLSLVPLFLCWGSFLNAFAFRLLRSVSIIYPRSYCPHCTHPLAWYDLVPVLSWILLRGKCRYCSHAISWLYPIIELITALSLSLLLMYLPLAYFFGYFIFFSALIVSIRTDVDSMLISRYVTLFLIPIGFAFSMMNLLPITILESTFGACIGYGLLALVAHLFYWCTKKEGLGEGDMELLGFIGAFIGPIGCWISLLLASISGTLFGIVYLYYVSKDKQTRIPFGPFLAFGAMAFVLFKPWLVQFFLGMSVL